MDLSSLGICHCYTCVSRRGWLDEEAQGDGDRWYHCYLFWEAGAWKVDPRYRSRAIRGIGSCSVLVLLLRLLSAEGPRFRLDFEHCKWSAIHLIDFLRWGSSIPLVGSRFNQYHTTPINDHQAHWRNGCPCPLYPCTICTTGLSVPWTWLGEM